MINHRFSVAPMMDWTDRHDRVFLRQFSKKALLYTEMVTSAALHHGDANYLLQHSSCEQPVSLQLGGSDPKELAEAASLGEEAGFNEINLNVGCPSNRVQSGAFGACLMANPKLVARCIRSMREKVSIPVTIKCRIGIDDQDSEAELIDFIGTVTNAGCSTFVIHARKAILKGLSPKENREIPPLNYGRVYACKESFPDNLIILNGGVSNLDLTLNILNKVDGVMMGREAYQNPYILSEVDNKIFNASSPRKTRIEHLHAYIPYMEAELSKGVPLRHMTRHLLGLFRGKTGGKQFRRHLSENAYKRDADINVLHDAIAYVN